MCVCVCCVVLECVQQNKEGRTISRWSETLKGLNRTDIFAISKQTREAEGGR